MKLEHLEQLIKIEKHGSISKAAKELYTTHSTLSNNLSNLENEIGVRLFERTPIGVTPTIEGKEIIKIAQSILDDCNQILSYGNKEHDLYGTVTVLIAPAFQFLYSNIMLKFQKAFPQAKLRLEVCLPIEIIQRIAQGSANIGMTLMQEANFEQRKNIISQGLKIDEIGHCTSKLFVSCHHPFASRECVFPQDLHDEQFVSYSEYHWNIINQYIKAEKTPFIIEDSEIIKQMIYNGVAVGYFPELLTSHDWRCEEKLICALSITGMENITEKVGCLIYPAKRQFSLIEKSTLKLISQILLTELK